MITAKYVPQAKLKELETFEFETYEAFFKFYMSHKNKGYIYDECDDGLTK
jgi:hypothetical protein